VNVRQTIRASLALLSRRDQRILILVTLAQMSTAFLDLLGVLLIGVVTALSVSVMSQAPLPAFVQSAMDRFGLADVDVITLATVLAVIAGIVLITKSIINVLLTRRILRFLANRQAMVSGNLAARLLSRPLLQVQQRSSQETVYALTSGVVYATLVVLGQGVVAVAEITLLAVLAVGLLLISPIVTIFAIVFFLLIALVLQRVLSGWAGRLGERSSHTEVASYSAIQEALRTYREVVVSNRRGLYVDRFQGLRWQAARIQSDLTFLSQIPKYVFEIALIVGAGLLAASQLFTKDLTAAVAIIAVFLAAGSRVVPSMLRLQTAAITMRAASGQAAPTFALADELSSVETTAIATAAFGSIDPTVISDQLRQGHPDFHPTISLLGIQLAYPGSTSDALANISFDLPAGSSLAIVGPTGAGKSTLADVILGVLQPDGGSVQIGGLSPAEAVARWPGALAYVPQDVAMANGTVRENVALGLPAAAIDDDWVWEALERAHLADFLQDSRDGLDTVIGEHGMKLSGGQRQRLGVARALYTRPQFLVLDEATSALDAETEQAIAKTLQELEGSVTTVTIAHRLATIRHCDLVLYMEAGAILASGTFDEVRRQAAHFDQQAQLLGM
jgi:ABC-type multidrug transport system fused ATPase/permease subunit